MSKIKINNQIVDYHWLSDTENVAAQQLLQLHHNRLRACCLCLNDARNRQLVIKKRSYFFLARKSGSCGNHAEWCELYFAPTLTLSRDGKLPAIIEKGDTLDVKLNCYLNVNRPDQPKINGGHTSAGTGANRSTVTLLGFLNLCLQKSRMNTWFPHRKYDRSFNTVEKNMAAIADDITIAKRPLSEILFMPRWEKDREHSHEQNQQRLLDKTAKSGKAIIVIGIVKRWIASKMDDGGIGVGLDLLDKLFWMPSETAAATERSFGQLISEIGKTDRYILAICTVFRSRQHFSIADIALMRTNRQFITVDSSYELRVADQLIAEQRAFTKPLRLDGERYLPDFLLNDCQASWVLEVFGVSGDLEYQARKMQKIAYYRDNQVPCWQWTPETDQTIPEFPLIKS